MNESDRTYLQIIKTEMIETLESGQLNAEQQYQVINQTLQKMLLLHNDKLTKTIAEYFADQEKIKEQMKEKNNDIKRMVESYSDNAKKIYEQIKKL